MKLFRGIREALYHRRKKKVQGGKSRDEFSPSVMDFGNAGDLKAAIVDYDVSDHASVSTDNDSRYIIRDDQPVQWKVPYLDAVVSDPQSMDEELKRLQVLQSYLILDADSEEEFDRITQLAKSVLDVPQAIISFVDFGRQWFLSRAGPGPVDAAVSETPRNVAFCAHVIMNKYKQLIVPDTTKDLRFRNNPLVLGGPNIRFYAGAALVSPEGYKLGTLCLLSSEPRPAGLSPLDQEHLHGLAKMVVSALVARRTRIQCQEYQSNLLMVSNLLKETSLSLRRSKKDLEDSVLEEHDLSEHSAFSGKSGVDGGSLWGSEIDTPHVLAVASAVKAMEYQSTLCSSAMRNIAEALELGEVATAGNSGQDIKHHKIEKVQETEDFIIKSHSDHTSSTLATNDTDLHLNASPVSKRVSQGSASSRQHLDRYDHQPTTNMTKVYKNINDLIQTTPLLRPHPKVVITMESNVPKVLVAEDLLVFRCVLNLLLHCRGEITPGHDMTGASTPIHLRIRSRRQEVLIECQESIPGAGKSSSSTSNKYAFRDPSSLLHPIATAMHAMGGKFGMYHGKLWIHRQNHQSADEMVHSSSVHWFSIPYDADEHKNSEHAFSRRQQTIHEATASSLGNKNNNNAKQQQDPFHQLMFSSRRCD